MVRLLLLFVLSAITLNAWAVNILPPTVQPERQTTKQPVPSIPYNPTDLITISPGDAKPTGTDTLYFMFNGFDFDGISVMPDEVLHPIYQDKLNKRINLIELYDITNQIENHYTSEGYILTRVILPPQEIAPGEKIRLVIIEGYIDEIEINAEDPKVKAFIKKMSQRILDSVPLKLSVLESTLLLMDDLPGLYVQGILSSSQTAVGATHLTINVEEKAYYLDAHIDNRGTVYTGPTEYLGAVTANNMGYVNQTQIEGTAAIPAEEMSAASITHTKPYGINGGNLQAVVNYSDVSPGDTLTPLDVQGYSTSFQLVNNLPILRQRRENLYVWMEYEIMSSKTNTLGELLYLDNIESVRFGAEYDFMDTWQGTNVFTTELSNGVQLFTGDNKPPFERSTYYGTKFYSKVQASATRLQSLPWNFSLFVSGEGQYSFDSLLAAEEFGVGGEDYGLAYDYYEISGDSGYAGRLELRKTFFPEIWGVTFFQPYVSYDGGQIFLKEDGFEQSILSLGGGVRFNVTDYFNGQVEAAKPLTAKVAATDSKDARVFFYFTLQL